MKLPGLIVPPLTPFTADLKVDEKALQAGVNYVVEDCNAAMVIAAGVEAQEYHYLTMEERKNLIAKTLEFVDGRCPVAVGISQPSFKIAIELAHYAEKIGAEAVQLLAPLRPFGGEPTQGELIAYFEAVSRESHLPMVLYLNPGPGANVSIPATIELSQLERVKYVKESSRDLSRVSRLISEIELSGRAKYFTTMQNAAHHLAVGRLWHHPAATRGDAGQQGDQGFRGRRYAGSGATSVAVCLVPSTLDAQWPNANNEGRNEDSQHPRRRSLPTLPAHPR